MRYTFDNLTPTSADLVLQWEKPRVAVPITVDVNTKVLAHARAEVAAAKADDWRTPHRAASWTFDAGVAPEEGSKWLQKSLAIQKSYATSPRRRAGSRRTARRRKPSPPPRKPPRWARRARTGRHRRHREADHGVDGRELETTAETAVAASNDCARPSPGGLVALGTRPRRLALLPSARRRWPGAAVVAGRRPPSRTRLR